MRHFDEAITAHTHARHIYQQTGDLHREGQAWGNLGIALTEVRRLNEARTSLQRAVTAFTRTGDTYRADIVRAWLDDLPRARRRWCVPHSCSIGQPVDGMAAQIVLDASPAVLVRYRRHGQTLGVDAPVL